MVPSRKSCPPPPAHAVSIYGIWFYDKEECQRIAELMKNLAQYEQLKAHHGAVVGASPVSLSSGEGKEADILRMLSKAKDEYTKCKACPEPKQISSSSAIYDNPNLIKPIPVKPSGSRQQRGPRPGQTLDPEPQHLSLTALFGKQDKATCQEAAGPPKTLHQQQQEKLPIRQGVVRSLSYEEPRRRSPPVDKQLCPAIQKLLVGSADLQPLAELPESWPCRDAARPGSPRGPEVSRRAHGLSPLMSPLVFAQPPWAPPPERGSGLLPPGSQDPAATPSGPLLPLRTPEPPRTPGSALTKPQLQEALLHLVQRLTP
ncbi:mRNA-decapping enzyme 1B, partial [Eschrichtius robustus]|nr:mRNA-decapping enzyme 1B [Eschrichtius robustus]